MICLNIKKTLFILIILNLLILPASTLAQPQGGQPPTTPAPVSFDIKISNPLGGSPTSIPALLEKIISEALLPIGAVVVVIMILYAGFLYVTAGGSKDKIDKAHTALKYGVIGAAILLGARVLAGAIQSTVTQIGG